MIEVKNLSKIYKVSRREAGMKSAWKNLFHRQYEEVKAIQNLSFFVEKGEMVGYIGPNGAGKSSTIKILSGILTPEEGNCIINGRIPWKERKEHVKDIGVVFGQRSQLWWDVPVIDSFELLKDIYQIPKIQYNHSLEELVSSLSLSTILKTPTRYFMFQRFHHVKGFTYKECLLCFSIVLMAFSLAEIFFRAFDTFPNIIGNGQFDRMLVRPRGLIFQVLASQFELTRLGRLLQAIILFLYVLATGDIVWNRLKIITICFMIISGTVIFASIFILYAGICFFTLDGLEILNIITDGAREYGKYPVSVYGKFVLIFSTAAIPYALFQYYPLLYIIGKSENTLYCGLPLIGMLFIIPCYIVWRVGVRKYVSTGS